MAARLELTDSMENVMMKMSDGNPGALTVCMRLLAESAEIDPDGCLGGLEAILSLDTLGLYGPNIWMLFKDVCGEDLVRTYAVLRGHQLGYVSQNDILHAINNRGDGLDPDIVLAQVQERLPRLGSLVLAEAQQDKA